MRSDEQFKHFWRDVENKAAIFDANPTRLPRKKRVPATIEECLGGSAAPEFNDDVVSHCRKIYYESLGCIIIAIED